MMRVGPCVEEKRVESRTGKWLKTSEVESTNTQPGKDETEE